MIWTPSKEARLRELVALGASRERIAAIFRTSTHAINGKIERLGITRATARKPSMPVVKWLERPDP